MPPAWPLLVLPWASSLLLCKRLENKSLVALGAVLFVCQGTFISFKSVHPICTSLVYLKHVF